MVTLAKLVNTGVAWTKSTYFRVSKANDVFDFDGITDFEPIGKYVSDATKTFQSSFDGNGVTIKNLKLSSDRYAGFFGFANGNKQHSIEHITIDKSCSFNGTGQCHGALLGYANNLDIYDCHNNGATVSTKNQVAGGLVGQLAGGTVSGCSSNANVSASAYAGGLIGTAVSQVVLNNCSVGMQLASGEMVTVASNSNTVGVEFYSQHNCDWDRQTFWSQMRMALFQSRTG